MERIAAQYRFEAEVGTAGIEAEVETTAGTEAEVVVEDGVELGPGSELWAEVDSEDGFDSALEPVWPDGMSTGVAVEMVLVVELGLATGSAVEPE